jgi:hypothetical protein
MASGPQRGSVYGGTAQMTRELGSPVPSDGTPGGKRRKPKKPRWAKVLIVLGSVLFVASLVGVGGAWTLMNRYEGQVKHDDLLGDALTSKKERDQHFASGSVNLLLLGSDSREGERDEGHYAGQRSDTIMMVHIAASRDKATIVSIPRDSFVNIPAGGNWKGGPNKLNAAFAFGGAPLAAKAVTEDRQLRRDPEDGGRGRRGQRLPRPQHPVELLQPVLGQGLPRHGRRGGRGVHAPAQERARR